MTIKIKLKERVHPIKAIDRRIHRFVRILKERWKPTLTQIQQAQGPITLEDTANIRALVEASLQQQAFDLVDDHIGRVFAYGAQIASIGEKAITKPPTMEVAAEAVRAGHFIDRQAFKFASAYALNEVQSKDSSLLSGLQTRLLQVIERGEHPSKAARQMAQDLDDDYAGWLRIARTETARSLQSGLFDEAKRLDVDVVYVPTSPTSCADCKRLIDGRVFMRSSIESATNYKRKQADWLPAVPLHPNCTHFAIPASQWLIDKAKEEAGGRIPTEGVKVEYLPPSER